MKLKFRFEILLSLICIFQIHFCYSQVTTKTYLQGIKDSKILSRLKIAKDFIIESPSQLSQLKLDTMKVDSNKMHDYSYKFATPINIRYDVMKNAKILAEKDTITYLIRLKAKGALNLSLHFSSFYLSKHSRMCIYNGKELTGPITEMENNTDNFWATRVYNGNSIVIEVNVPKSEIGITHLVVSKVFLGYKHTGFNEYFGSPGASAQCNVNLFCPQNTGSGTVRYAVAMINPNGTNFFTGTLIMTTCNTNRPYLLTANHAYTAASNVSQWVFQFQYWSTNCSTNTGWIESVQFNGATLKANWAVTDFALVQLNQVPPSNSGIVYAGWSRRTPAPGIYSVPIFSLHHPRGDLMKYSSDNNFPALTSYGGTDNLWLANFDYGTVEPGSSGSALFDANARVIGQLYGSRISTSDYCAIRRGEYGRFDMSWTGGGTRATRLSDWLDASNTNAFTTNSTGIANLTNASPNLSISGNSSLCSSGSYTLNGATAGTISWTSSNTSIATVTQGNPATVTKVGNGSVNITATVTFCPNVTTAVTKTISVGVPNNYYISSTSMNSPNRLDIYTSFTGYQLSATSWSVYVDGSFSTSGSGYPPSVISVYAGCGSHSITLTTSNSCGSYSTSSSSTGSGCYTYALAPNPATGNVTITNTTANSSLGSTKTADGKLASTAGKVTITVFDNANRPLKQFNFSQSSRYNFSVANLTPGTYIVQIKQNGTINSLKLIKE